MKHLILGTAGHVDHGKTALVRALTGIECDTHKEEKARGITINLGFAHLDLGEGMSLGIVDVPGHRDFVHTMVAGASGIDLAMLVVAADSGVMPQTQEHLEIMDVLGIRAGLVAITKADLVETEIAELAAEEVRDMLKGTFLDGCPIAAVSSVTGQGLDDLKKAIQKVATGLKERSSSDVFRLYPDRIFSVSGFGTVVTGSVLGGSISNGDTVFLLPVGKKLRIRRIERHGQEVQKAVAGDRASINLVGLEKEDFKKGMLISDRPLKSTTMLDAGFTLFKGAKDLGLWTHAAFYVGTYEEQAKVHLITADSLAPSEKAIVQIHLESPCVVQFNDRFVLRSTSSDVTLGGGEIIDPSPLHHKRRTEKLKKALVRVTEGKLPELISVEIKKQRSPLSIEELAVIFNISAQDINDEIQNELPDYLVLYQSGEKKYLAVVEDRDELRQKTLQLIERYHAANPLSQLGRTAEEMMGTLKIARGSSADVVFRLMLNDLAAENELKQFGHTWVRASHSVVISQEQQRAIDLVENFLRASLEGIPSLFALDELAKAKGIGADEVRQILKYLVEKGLAYTVDGEFFHSEQVDKIRKITIKALKKDSQGITVGRLRDLTSTSRRMSLILLQLFETEGIITRVGDLRVLSKKGEALAE